MSHYDCSDCGSGMGVAFGSCDNCTPKELLELDRLLRQARSNAHVEFQAMMGNKEMEFVRKKTKKLQEQYDKMYKTEYASYKKRKYGKNYREDED